VTVAIVDAGTNQVNRSVEVNAPAAELFAAVLTRAVIMK